MPSTLNSKSSPTLIPCPRCGAMSWAKPGRAQLACDGCGESLEVGQPRPASGRPSLVAGRSEPTRVHPSCQRCGRSARLGRPCVCGGDALAASLRPTLALPAQRASLAAMAHHELLVPWALLAGGVLLGTILGAGQAGLVVSLVAGLLFVGLYVLVGLFAGYLIGGSLMGWELGPLGRSSLHLAAIAAFDWGGDALVRVSGFGAGSIVVWIGGWLLMMHFFKLSFAQCLLFRLAMSACAVFGFMSVLAALA